MADVAWPTILRPASGGNPEPAFANVAGPTSAKGRSQVVATDAGFWTVRWAGVPLYTPEHWRAYNATRVLLNGRVNRSQIPIFALGIQAWPNRWGNRVRPPKAGRSGPLIYVTNDDTIAVGDMEATIRARRGTTELYAGMMFSYNSRLYMIQKVNSRTRTSGDELVFEIEFWPPCREQILFGNVLDFDKPTLWARLASDDEMSAAIDPAHLGSFDVNWVEDV